MWHAIISLVFGEGNRERSGGAGIRIEGEDVGFGGNKCQSSYAACFEGRRGVQNKSSIVHFVIAT